MNHNSRNFSLIEIKRLHTRQNFVYFNLKEGTVIFNKVKGGGEKRKEFRCSDFTLLEKGTGKNDKRLRVTYGVSKPETRLFLFESAAARDMWCQILIATVISAGKAWRVFAELDQDHSGFLDPEEVKRALTDLGVSTHNIRLKGEMKFEEFLLIYAQNYLEDPNAHKDGVALPAILDMNASAAAKKRSNSVSLNDQAREALGLDLKGRAHGTGASAAADVSIKAAVGQWMANAHRVASVDDGATSVDDIDFLEGEQVRLMVVGVYHLENKYTGVSKVQGSLVITSYRIYFHSNRANASDTATTDVPMGVMDHMDKPDVLPGSNECSLTIYCKDSRVVKFAFESTINRENAVALIADIAWPQDAKRLFAYSHTFTGLSNDQNGWTFFQPHLEYERLGFAKSHAHFRWCSANMVYKLSPTYPSLFIVPKHLEDIDLAKVALYRSKARVPAMVFLHPHTQATISRCAQPLAGLKGRRSPEDERMIAMIREANPTNNQLIYLMDARPNLAAVGNKIMGKGSENEDNYKHAVVKYLNIDNIHAIRESLSKLTDLIGGKTTFDDDSWYSKLADTKWLYYVRLILQAAVDMVNLLEEEGCSIVFHCSDGWDRTSQVCSLAELMIDPFYRTRRGFAILVEKEWLSFGHMFAERYGQGSKEWTNEQRAPIFEQWIDCVWQIWRQFPHAFEFNEEFLLALNDHLFSCRFGTFLFDNEAQRHEANVSTRTVSLWSWLCHDNTALQFVNPSFVRSAKRKASLRPNCTAKKITLWEQKFLRWDQECMVKDSVAEGQQRLFARYLALRTVASKLGADLREDDLKHDPYTDDVTAIATPHSKRFSLLDSALLLPSSPSHNSSSGTPSSSFGSTHNTPPIAAAATATSTSASPTVSPATSLNATSSSTSSLVGVGSGPINPSPPLSASLFQPRRGGTDLGIKHSGRQPSTLPPSALVTFEPYNSGPPSASSHSSYNSSAGHSHSHSPPPPLDTGDLTASSGSGAGGASSSDNSALSHTPLAALVAHAGLGNHVTVSSDRHSGLALSGNRNSGSVPSAPGGPRRNSATNASSVVVTTQRRSSSAGKAAVSKRASGLMVAGGGAGTGAVGVAVASQHAGGGASSISSAGANPTMADGGVYFSTPPTHPNTNAMPMRGVHPGAGSGPASPRS